MSAYGTELEKPEGIIRKYHLGLVIPCLLISFFFLTLTARAWCEPLEIAGKTLSIDECVAIALKANPASEISIQNLKAVQGKVGEAKGGYYPSFKLASFYTYTAQQAIMPIGPDAYDTRFFARQTLFDAGATKNLVESVKSSIAAQEYDVKRTDSDIIVAVKTAFYDVLKRRDLVDVARTSLASIEKHLEQSKSLYKEGIAPRSDVIKSEVQVSNARLDVIKADNALLLAKANLTVAMGMPVTASFDIVHSGTNKTHVLPPLKDSLLLAYDLRPELKGNMAKIQSAEANIRQAESGLYPNVSLDTSYGWQQDSFLPNETKWSVGLTVGIPIFDHLIAKSKVNQAKAGRDSLRATETQLTRNVEMDVEQAWLALKEAEERFEVAKKALEQAEEDMRVSEGRYKEGLANILEVIDAQTALTQAKANFVTDIYDISSSEARLDRATGRSVKENR
jgi:outer membrane protein